MQKKNFISNNYFFSLPCLLWLIGGGIVQLLGNQQSVFTAINSRNSPFGDVVMYYATWLGQAEVIVPVLLSLFLFKKFRNLKYFVAAIVCNIIPFALQQSLKSYYDLPRPLSFLQNPTWHIHYRPNWDMVLHRSFPSGHSVGAFSFFCFLSLLLPQKYKKYGLLFFFLALLVGYSRMYLAAHFFEDVYVGSIIGWLCTTALFSIFNKIYFSKCVTTSL